MLNITYVLDENSSTSADILGSSKRESDWEKQERGNSSSNIECKTLPSQQQIPVLKRNNKPSAMLNVLPNKSYNFRIIGENEKISPLTVMSSPISVLQSGMEWEAKQFISRYLELNELGNGRFSTVRRARDRGTDQEVALKQTTRHKQSRSLTRAEYDLLASTHHSNIVRAFALFENAPQPGIDTIVMEL